MKMRVASGGIRTHDPHVHVHVDQSLKFCTFSFNWFKWSATGSQVFTAGGSGTYLISSYHTCSVHKKI